MVVKVLRNAPVRHDAKGAKGAFRHVSEFSPLAIAGDDEDEEFEPESSYHDGEAPLFEGDEDIAPQPAKPKAAAPQPEPAKRGGRPLSTRAVYIAKLIAVGYGKAESERMADTAGYTVVKQKRSVRPTSKPVPRPEKPAKPAVVEPKTPICLRLPDRLLKEMRKGGPGYQARIVAVLEAHVKAEAEARAAVRKARAAERKASGS